MGRNRAGARPHATASAKWTRSEFFDAGAVAIAAGSALFVLYLRALGPALFILLAGLLLWRKLDLLPRLTGALGGLLLIPAFALLSTLWSSAPATSAYSAVQYLITILVALLLGAGASGRSILLGLFVAFGVYTMGSALLGSSVQWGVSATAYNGLAASKNTAADTAALGLLVSLAMLAAGLGAHRLWLVLTAAALAAVNAWLIAAAHSTGSLLACIIATSCLVLWSLARSFSPRLARPAFIGSILLCLAGFATHTFWLEPLYEMVLTASGKDQGLTGRGYIWERADVLVAQRPWLGTGFQAFWGTGNLEAEAILRALHIAPGRIFNFHNTYYEIAVHLGLVGVLLVAAVASFYLASLLLRTARRPDQVSLFFCSLAVYELVRLGFESIALQQFHHSTLLIFMGFAWATRPLPVRAATPAFPHSGAISRRRPARV